MGTNNPRLFLAVDNCFAAKRWTEPDEWGRAAVECGFRFVEASADNEADILYRGRDNMSAWVEDVRKAERRHGFRVANVYSGHGTYATLGLGHTNEAIADRFLERWVEPMIETAGALDAGLGFFAHAFPVAVLEDPQLFTQARSKLIERFARIALIADKRLARPLAVEQMYTPHQIPWTIGGTIQLIKDVFEKAAVPLYTTIDTGHQSGQAAFGRPDFEQFQQAVAHASAGMWNDVCWIGPEAAYAYLLDAASDRIDVRDAWDRIQPLMDERPYLFSSANDADPYEWLRAVGTFSPIVHLQQTDSTSSSHLPFTPTTNATGIITGEHVLRSLKQAYDATEIGSLLPPIENIFLTVEFFAGTSSRPFTVIQHLRETAAYWRGFIPEDGISLAEALRHIEET